ncbi:hypothetical protein MTO96_045014 [Rhipicephalus appendiculatus]
MSSSFQEETSSFFPAPVPASTSKYPEAMAKISGFFVILTAVIAALIMADSASAFIPPPYWPTKGRSEEHQAEEA